MDELRLFLHLLAATVWVGGQLVLGALVPVLRAAGPDVPGAAARAFARIAWPAFGVLIVTGIWNIAAAGDQSSERGVLAAKLVVVAASGATAALHARSTTPRGRGLFGALTAVSAVLALLLGVVLRG